MSYVVVWHCEHGCSVLPTLIRFYTVGEEYTVLLPDRNSFASHLCHDECGWKLQVWNFKSLVSLVKLGNPPPLVTCWRLCSSALRQRHLLERVPTIVRKATNPIQLSWNLGVLENSQEDGRDSEAVLPTNTPPPPCTASDQIPKALSTFCSIT